MSLGSPGNPAQLNAEARWDSFDPVAYVRKNYRTVLPVDAEIMAIVRAHFSDHFRRLPGLRVRGIDVGAGANLYPSFMMLPWCDEITLLDRARPNLHYLQQQLGTHDHGWDAFWRELCPDDAYATLPGGPWERLREVARVEQGDLRALVDRPEQWQLGTMFFVAESLSTAAEEFHEGVGCFLRSLEPGAPFAAAFMEHSEGCWVGETFFPACDVSEFDIRGSIEQFAEHLVIYRVGEPGEVRPGYTCMILACGFRRAGSSRTRG
ncbi:SCO2525 family SAM-dependent methyltransferase [Streptomyces capoamus]|uniref:SCO2525 family SAM-dependent methyltransferase n=1 Tax=Streptomyces capoamus TaxID=68183 RepID=UPI001677FABC|nr:SCO2525 family SAM-dependent methyltransferase [Streptomyces capoamus]